jgi:hypothetical protein
VYSSAHLLHEMVVVSFESARLRIDITMATNRHFPEIGKGILTSLPFAFRLAAVIPTVGKCEHFLAEMNAYLSGRVSLARPSSARCSAGTETVSGYYSLPALRRRGLSVLAADQSHGNFKPRLLIL